MSLIHHRWLAEQLPAWELEGIVTADGARKLRERYAAQPQGGLAQMVVGALGALLIGTGLIAVLAYNWDDFPRSVRLALALGPLAAAQAASWWVLGRGESARAWMREASGRRSRWVRRWRWSRRSTTSRVHGPNWSSGGACSPSRWPG